MALKQMNVDIRSKIAESFFRFCRCYCLTQIVNPLSDDCEYRLVLRCEGNSVVIEVSNDKGLKTSNTFSMEYVMMDNSLISIVESFSCCDVDIDMMTVHFTSTGLKSISLNIDEDALQSKGEYLMNKETGKLELYFDKEVYQGLPDSDKSMIKSAFLFSKAKGAWLSRAKFPNLWRAEQVAKKLNLLDKGKTGESISFEEQMKRKSERAEARAERYESRAEKAKERGNELQKPLDRMHGDIAFFTQPNINSSSGRAFTRRRDRMFAAYEKGFEEFRKSEYYKDRAKTAMETAKGTKPTDKGFCVRRIEEAEKIIKAQRSNLDHYNSLLEKIRSGKQVRRFDGTIITESEVYTYIDTTEGIIEQNISKSIYYHECLDELGGIGFSKENIKKDYIVELQRWGRCRVKGTGPKNITYEILDGGAAGMGGTASYAEIKRIISDELPDKSEILHPFKVGDVYNVKDWDGEKFANKEYKVIKVSRERVTLKSGAERAINRKPRRFRSGDSKTGYSWALGICDGRWGTIYKEETVNAED